MALHHELPIYKGAYKLLSYLHYKQLVGSELRTECLQITVLIFRANVARVKTPFIQEILERLQVVELMLRMSCDMRWISTGNYASSIEMTQSIGKQAAGWKKSKQGVCCMTVMAIIPVRNLNLVKAAFRGYAALPQPSSGDEDWRDVFGYHVGDSLKEVKALYRSAMSINHPDKQGGNDKEASRLNAALEAAKLELNGGS